jgi:hypothetical protein
MGRPRHDDDPPKLFSTTIPSSIYRLLVDLSARHRRTKSAILTEALRAYARRFPESYRHM